LHQSKAAAGLNNSYETRSSARTPED